ncbi:MAG: hypothetical protein EBR51_05285 [Gammaproteobacteria bacterium]|nr:hypothetical protein [Gammaproteobacteria bacterium]
MKTMQRVRSSNPLEAHERAVHVSCVYARDVLRVCDDDQGHPRGRGLAGLLWHAHKHSLLAAERHGLVGREERDDGAVVARAACAAGGEPAQVRADDPERGSRMRL